MLIDAVKVIVFPQSKANPDVEGLDIVQSAA